MSETTIQWTDKTWNPVTGCQKISPGCKHCYAETIAERFWAKQYSPTVGGKPRPFTDVRVHDDRLEQPLKWRKPARIFVNSMSDLFHEKVPFSFIRHVWDIISEAQQHTFQILTKRPERLYEFTQWMAGADHISVATWPRNAWIGISAEDQANFEKRIPYLTAIPAAVRWISFEPLLGPINTEVTITPHKWAATSRAMARIGWAVVGGESGAGARPMSTDWARRLRDQCQQSGIPFFMKQLGGVRDAMGELSDFPEDLRIREYPA